MTARRPLRPHPRNPRWFEDGTGRAVLLGGSHTWANFASDPGCGLDYDRYLDFLVAHGHNFFRGWIWDVPHSRQSSNGGPFDWTPQPWLRTGPGSATDGEPRFDLTAWDPAFFDRIRDRAIRAGDRGIYVAVMLFQGFAWQFDRTDADGFPLDGRNNVNGVDSGVGRGASTLEDRDVLRVQEEYVRRVVEAVGDLDNVLFEIANEAWPGSTDWQYHHIRHLHELERGRPMQHAVGMTFQFEGGTLAALENSPADWISPDSDPVTRETPPVADGSKVVVYDTDHGFDWRSLRDAGAVGQRAWVWKCVTRGSHVLFMDPYLARIEIDGEARNAPIGVDPREPYFGLEPDPLWEPLRQAIGDAVRMSGAVDLAALTPHPELTSTSWCLADPGQEYLVFAPDAQEGFTVDATASDYVVRWLDAATGVWELGGALSSSGGPTSIAWSGVGDAVLHLRRS